MKILKTFCCLLFFILGAAVCAFSKDKIWNEEKSSHFEIFYKTAPKDFVKNVEKMAEHYYDDIYDNLGLGHYQSWSWDDRAKIYIYDDEDDYVQNAGQFAWSHGVASPQGKMIRTFPSAHGFFDSTLPHELGHIVFREMVGFQTDVPLWFEEGVAMFQEQAKRFGSHKAVQEAIKNGKFIPLDELAHLRLDNRSDDALVQLFYAESASVVYYLIEQYGTERFKRLCREMKEKGSFEMTLGSVYYRIKSTDGLNKEWVKYLTNE